MSLAKRLGDLYAHVEEELSLRELGALAGIAETYPSLIVSGARKKIGWEIAVKLGVVLGCAAEYLLSGSGKRPTADEVRDAVEVARARARRQPKRTGTTG